MQTMRESWTDERLDDLNDKVKAGRGEMKEGFDAVNVRIDSVQQTMAHGVIALTIAILAGFAAITGLLATQL
jgi:hypothetical protein